MHRYIISLILIITFCSTTIFGQKLENNTALNNSIISYVVIDAESGEELLSHNADYSMTPASVFKLLPTAAALEKFGPNSTFTTVLAYSGSITDGTLNGNIYIIGGGDPALGSLRYKEHYYQPVSFLQSWVNMIKRSGIKRINGDVIAIENQELNTKVPRTWLWEDISNHFGASPGMLNIYENLYHIHFNTENSAGTLSKITGSQPSDIGLIFDNQVTIAKGGGDQAFIFGSPDSFNRTVRGTLPKGYSNFVVKGSIPNPALLAAQHLYKHITAAGVPVSGEASTEKSIDNFTVLDSLNSPKLSELIRMTNFRSINLYANMIGSRFSPDFKLTEACNNLLKFWSDKGMNTKGLYLEDACGLSPFDQISANQLAFVLNYMNSSKYKEEFKASLPVSGQSGTLKYFGQNKSFKLKFHGKSGSIKRVYTYAGYLTSNKGKELIIVGMTNHYSCTSREAKSALVDFFDYVYKSY